MSAENAVEIMVKLFLVIMLMMILFALFDIYSQVQLSVGIIQDTIIEQGKQLFLQIR